MEVNKIDLNNFDKSDWPTYRFDQIAQNISERVDPNNTDLEVYIGLEHIDSESLHIKRFGTPDDVNGQKLKFYKGDIIFGRRRAYQRKAGIANCDGFCSAHALVLRANPEVIEPQLFPFFLHSNLFMNRAIDISVGSLSPTINWGTLKHQEFKIPPQIQQRDLANLLWGSDELLKIKKFTEIKLKVLLDSSKKSSFDYGYGNYSAELPPGWVMLKVKEFSKVQAGSTPLRSNKNFFDGGTTPWLKTLDLNNGLIFKTEEKVTDLAIEKTSCKIKPVNTVLVAMYGGYNQIGRTGLLKIPSATNQAVAAIEVDEDIINPEYLLHLLNAKIDYWKKVAISSRKDPNITKNDVENFPVPIPPRDMQDEIVDSINLIISTVQDAQRNVCDFKRLQSNLIDEVF